jgi:hypothetical protein
MQTIANCAIVRFTEGKCTHRACLLFANAGKPMRIKIAITASLAVLAAGSSRADDNKACVLKATETLPHISGLVVKKTRTRPVPPAILATWQGQTRPIMVDLDTVAAGAYETFSYMCVLTKGAAYVRRVMS